MGAAAYKVIRVKFAVQEIERRSLRALVMRSRNKEDHATRRLQGKFLRFFSIWPSGKFIISTRILIAANILRR